MTKASRGLIVVKKKSQKSALKPAENSQTKQDLTQKPNSKAENSQPKTAKNSPKAVKNSQTKSRDLQNSRQAQPEMATSNKGYTMTLSRKLEIANFRNLGIGEKVVLELNADATKGDLLILIGENNSGKSNVLRALQAFGDKSIADDDVPNFVGKGEKPSLRLAYSAKSPRQKDEFRQLDEKFKDKVFNVVFTPNAIETGADNQKISEQEYVARCKKLFSESQVLCMCDLNIEKGKPREEIRLILRDTKKEAVWVFLCSAEQAGKDLKCFFRAIQYHRISEVKNYNKAFVANCRFDIECEKPNLLDNAADLKKFLKADYEKCSQSLEDDDSVESYFFGVAYSEQKSERIDKNATIKAFKDKIDELRKFADESELNKLQEGFESFSQGLNTDYNPELYEWYNKLKDILFKKIEWVRHSGYYSSEYYECGQNTELLDEQFEYFAYMDLAKKQKEFDSLHRKWQKLKDGLENKYDELKQSHINELQEHYTKLQELFFPQNEFNELLHYEHAIPTQDDTLDDEFKKKFGIKPCPQVIFYNEKRLKDDDLSVKPENLENSSFFPSLFKILDDKEKWLNAIKEHYAKQEFYDRDSIEEKINEQIKQKVATRFNKLYGKNGVYGFKIRLDDEKIKFSFTKHKEPLKLSQQSEGFKWFFNFFFNFLHAQSLEKGDIVLIDEFGANLSIPAQRDLRDFLKDYAKQNALTFIISTHSPFLADMDFLDELRIIRQKGDGSSEIKNSFSLLDEGETDALREIKQAFGVQHFWGLKRFVFVEGITDYNYLTKFKRLYEAEKGLKRGEGLNFAFLPVNGLGKFEDGEETLTKKQEQLIEQLPKIAKANKDNCAILLVDNDKAGQAIKKAVKARENRDLVVITLDDAFDENAHIGAIESLFSPKDSQNLGGKGTLPSQNFKNNHEPDKESKERFYRLLEYLNGYTEADE